MSDAADLPPPGRGVSPGPQPSEAPEKASRSTKRWFTFLGAWLADVLILDVAATLPRHSLVAYQWVNRIGIFLGLPLVFGFCIVGLSVMRQWQGSRSILWVGRGAAVLLPLIFVAKLWVRILDAFWLR